MYEKLDCNEIFFLVLSIPMKVTHYSYLTFLLNYISYKDKIDKISLSVREKRYRENVNFSVAFKSGG